LDTFGDEFVVVPVVDDGAIFRGNFGCWAERAMTLLAASFWSPRLLVPETFGINAGLVRAGEPKRIVA